MFITKLVSQVFEQIRLKSVKTQQPKTTYLLYFILPNHISHTITIKLYQHHTMLQPRRGAYTILKHNNTYFSRILVTPKLWVMRHNPLALFLHYFTNIFCHTPHICLVRRSAISTHASALPPLPLYRSIPHMYWPSHNLGLLLFSETHLENVKSIFNITYDGT